MSLAAAQYKGILEALRTLIAQRLKPRTSAAATRALLSQDPHCYYIKRIALLVYYHNQGILLRTIVLLVKQPSGE